MVDEKRVYPVRDPKIAAQEQADYLLKIAENRKAGQIAFESGEYNPFNGYNRDRLIREFNVILLLDPASQAEVAERVGKPLEKLAEAHQIPAIFAGESDLPPHVTLQIGRNKNLTGEKFSRVEAWLKSGESHLEILTLILQGLTFHHDTLVMAPNSYICASRFDDEQGAPFRARRAIETMMSRATRELGLDSDDEVVGVLAPPRSYYDTFHTTVARLTKKASSQNLKLFAQEANTTIGKSLLQNPLKVRVSEVFRGNTADFVLRHAPHLLSQSAT